MVLANWILVLLLVMYHCCAGVLAAVFLARENKTLDQTFSPKMVRGYETYTTRVLPAVAALGTRTNLGSTIDVTYTVR